MKRAVVSAGVVGVLSLLAACGSTGQDSAATAPAPATSAPALPTTVTVTAPVTQEAPPPVAASIPDPVVYTGVGETYLTISKPAGTSVVIATITGNAVGRYFGVRALDGDKDKLVETNSPYSGSTLLDAHGGNTTRLYIKAWGSWTIKLSDPRSATVFGHDESGSGDTVLAYQGAGGRAVISGGQPGTMFRVTAFGAGALAGDLAWDKAPFDQTVRWPGGTALIAVRATGPWSITVN